MNAYVTRFRGEGLCAAPDGSLLDVTLLAAVAALSNLQLPAVRVNEDGNVVPAAEGAEVDGAAAQADGMAEHEGRQSPDRHGSALSCPGVDPAPVGSRVGNGRQR